MQSNSLAPVSRGWEGGGPEHPAAGAVVLFLYRWRDHREDRLVEAACETGIGLMGPPIVDLNLS